MNTYPILDYAIVRESQRVLAELELLRCLLAAPVAARNVRDAGLRESDIGQPDLRVMYAACLRRLSQPRERVLSEIFCGLRAASLWHDPAHRHSRGLRWSARSLASFGREFNPLSMLAGELLAVREALTAAATVKAMAMRSREAARHFDEGAAFLGCRGGNPMREAAEIVKLSRLSHIEPALLRRAARKARAA